MPQIKFWYRPLHVYYFWNHTTVNSALVIMDPLYLGQEFYSSYVQYSFSSAVKFHQLTWHRIQEDSTHHNHDCKDLKPDILIFFFFIILRYDDLQAIHGNNERILGL
jgi:hypothetical protein